MPREGQGQRPRGASARDQSASAFTHALERLCESLPAVAVALVDGEGETVDYAGRLSPFETRVAAAEWQLVLTRSKECCCPPFETTKRIMVRAQGRSFCALALSEGYALIVVLPRGSFSTSERAFSEAIREISDEAGLPLPAEYRGQQWTRVRVHEWAGEMHRPERIFYGDAWHSLVVLGRYRDEELRARETGYRVRLENGFETTLVRERLGRWFSDHSMFGVEFEASDADGVE